MRKSPLQFPSQYHRLLPRTDRMNAAVLYFASKCRRHACLSAIIASHCSCSPSLRLRMINLEGCTMLASSTIDALINKTALKGAKPSLKFLYLALCTISESTLITIAEKCQNRLKVLDLYGCRSLSLQAVASVVGICPGLRYLNITGVGQKGAMYTPEFLCIILQQKLLHTLYLDMPRLNTTEGNAFIDQFLQTHPNAKVAMVQSLLKPHRRH